MKTPRDAAWRIGRVEESVSGIQRWTKYLGFVLAHECEKSLGCVASSASTWAGL